MRETGLIRDNIGDKADDFGKCATFGSNREMSTDASNIGLSMDWIA